MAKIKNTKIYRLENEPTLSDFLVGTKKTNGVTKNFSLESIINLINGVNGKNNVQFKFSSGTHPSIDATTAGYFFTDTNETDPDNFNQLIFNKSTLVGTDLSVLFNFLGERDDITLKLENPSDPNQFFIFKIVGFEDFTDYFVFDVEVLSDLYIGQLVNNTIYSVYWDYASSAYQPDTLIKNTEAIVSGSDRIYPALGYEVIIDQNFYRNPIDFETTINPATDGFYRTDLIYITIGGIIGKLEGDESETEAPAKPLPDNSLAVSYIPVFGAIIGEPTTPIGDPTKEDKSNKVADVLSNISSINYPSTLGLTTFTYSKTQIDSALFLKINTSEKAQPFGVATLDGGGKIPVSQLPSYVDDILEGYLLSNVFYIENSHTTVIPAEAGKIYIDLTTGQKNKEYRYSGSTYIQITNGLIASTDDVPEGSTNLYFTVARVLATALTGLSLATGGAIVSTDTVLQAFGKLQKQINDLGSVYVAISNFFEEKLFGTSTENLTVTGTVNFDLSSATTQYLKLTGNTTATLTGLPAVGKTITRTFYVKSNTNQTLGVTNATYTIGAYVADGSLNLVTIECSNFTTTGVINTVQFQKIT